jgi:hypothetical protein
MKKVILLVAAVALLAPAAFADWRADIGVDIPWKIGVSIDTGSGDPLTQTLDVLEQFTFLLPEAFVAYEVPLGPVSLGLGGRIFTFLVESVIYPAAFAEVALGPVAVNLNVGGGAFGFFGLYNNVHTGQLVIPDLSANFLISDSLRIGVGTAALIFDQAASGTVPFIVYLGGKFVVRF